MRVTLTCQRCGQEGVQRNRPAKYCFPCVPLCSKDSGADAARAAVARAVKAGRLPKASTLICVDCGKAARDYDHRDHNKPLDVAPVCHSCNKLRGPAIPLRRVEPV